MTVKYHCKCGLVFDKRPWLIEHIGICNPHWPRAMPEDEHAVRSELEVTQDVRIQRLENALHAIAAMDVYTREGEKEPHEVMRDIAKTALNVAR